MRNVTVKYYKTGSIKETWGNKGNCARCKEFKPLEEHHIRTRSKGGKKTVRVCSACHRWIGSNIKEATKLGLYKGGYGEDI